MSVSGGKGGVMVRGVLRRMAWLCALVAIGSCGTAAMGQTARVGACCARISSGSLVCVQVTRADCTTLGGTYDGDMTSCSSPGVCQGAPRGACCLPGRPGSSGGHGGSGNLCNPTMNEVQCVNAGGTYQGDGVSCRSVNCPQPPPATGACCFALGVCAQVTRGQCVTQGGTYHGDRSDCATTLCPGAPRGACCLPTPGGNGHGPPVGQCTHLPQVLCVQRGGVYQGDNTSCRNVSCPPPPLPTGACCIAGVCTQTDLRTCQTQSGTYMGNNTSCTTTPCPGALRGACCLPPRGGGGGVSNCMRVPQALCNAMGGLYQGDGTQCPPRGCPASTFVGACCTQDPAGSYLCVDVTQAVCSVLGGTYSGLGVVCATVNCPGCPCDLNGDGVVDLADEAIALANHAALNFDFDHDGDTDQDDLTAFYACINAGC